MLDFTDPAHPTFTAPDVDLGGAYLRFQLTVRDSFGGVDVDETIVTVQDLNDPPVCDLARPSIATLWPPNHKMVPIEIVGIADPENAQVNITITGVTQDEPVNGLGDGDSSPDATIFQSGLVSLRSERSGLADGRVYQVHFTADDGQGGICSGAVSVDVPHDMRHAIIDSGQYYDSTAP
jgi:hypothetical protein